MKIRCSFNLCLSLVETNFTFSSKTLYTDNGGEFLALLSFLATHGITHLITLPYTHEHNGYSKCRHRHIIEMGLTLLYQASILLTFWPYAFTTVVYLINRMPKVGLSLDSSFEKLVHKAPNPSKLRVFGCLCFPWLCLYSSHKLDPKSKPCVFLGTPSFRVPFSILTISSKKYVSRHVKFVKNIFPFTSPLTSTTPVVDTNFTFSTSSYILGDNSASLTSSPSPHLSSRRTTPQTPIPLPSPELSILSSLLHPSSL